jgi:MerR family transcriptional regulator, light-induced transcriptional regulator
MENEKVHPIGVAERRTGLSAHVIRKWEERYGVVEPARNIAGRRLYSEADIKRIDLLHRAAGTGRSIGQLIDLTNETLERYIAADSVLPVDSQSKVKANPSPVLSQAQNLSQAQVSPAASSSAASSSTQNPDLPFMIQTAEQFIQAAQEYSDTRLERLLDRAYSKLGQHSMIDNLIPLIMHKLGDAWEHGLLRIGQEHLATFRVEAFLIKVLNSLGLPESAPYAVAASFKDQQHTIGVLSISIISRSVGWQTVYMGGNAPVEEISGAVEALRAKVLLLSFNYPYSEHTLQAELAELKRTLSPDVTIIAGGRPAVEYQKKHPSSGLVVLNTFSELRQRLRVKKGV